MSDFWEKNKGTFASGLKKTGKIGLNGTKYVAKTGYQASKNFNNKNKSERNYSEEDFDNDFESKPHYHGHYSSYRRDPSSFPPPPRRTSPSQNVNHHAAQFYDQQSASQQPPSLPQRSYLQHSPPPRSEYQQWSSSGYQQSTNSGPPSPPRPNGRYPTPIQMQTTEGSYPEVHPYSLTEPHVKPKVEMAPVDLSNIPPPPTHKDRNSPIRGQSQEFSNSSKSPPSSLPTYEDSQKNGQSTTSLSKVAPSPALPPRPGSISSSAHSSIPPQIPPKPGMVDVSLFPPPPKPKPTPSAERESSFKSRDPTSTEPTPRGRLADSKPPPPPVKPKPRNLSAGGKISSSNSTGSTPATTVDTISQELSQVQLKKTNPIYSQGTQATSSKQPPPPPPVPSKTPSLKSPTDQQEANPFERYLKSAVPAENDRLHKPM